MNKLVNYFKNLKFVQLYRYYFTSDYISLHNLIQNSLAQVLAPPFMIVTLAYLLEVNSIIMILAMSHFLMSMIALIDGGVGAVTHVTRQIKREHEQKLNWYSHKCMELDQELRIKQRIIEQLQAEKHGRTSHQQRADTNHNYYERAHHRQQQQRTNTVTDRIRAYYTVLGINPTLDINEVKKAYRRQAQIHHPDKGGNNQQFVKVQKAYDEIKKALAAVGR